MSNLYVFGNEYLDEDSFAKEVAKELDQTNIIYCNTPDVILESEEKKILILDVVKGISKPIIIKDLNKIKTRNIMSLHDLDLGYVLKLMSELGIEKEIKIIGIPQKGNKKEIIEQVKKWIKN